MSGQGNERPPPRPPRPPGHGFREGWSVSPAGILIPPPDWRPGHDPSSAVHSSQAQTQRQPTETPQRPVHDPNSRVNTVAGPMYTREPPVRPGHSSTYYPRDRVFEHPVAQPLRCRGFVAQRS